VATFFAGWSLLPLTLGLGASAYVVFARFAGNEIGLAFAGLLTATGLSLLYGLGFSLRKRRKALPPESETSLKTKIEQLLTEARVIIPGGQALLGFQFVATLTKAFDNLPDEMKWFCVASDDTRRFASSCVSWRGRPGIFCNRFEACRRGCISTRSGNFRRRRRRGVQNH